MIFPGNVLRERYRADLLLGRGGMGEVWRCFDLSLNRMVVIKIVNSELARTRAQFTNIFIDEARIGSSLVGHPNVVAIFDLINEPSSPDPLLAIVMEYVEGMSCAEWIENAPSHLDPPTQHYLSLMVALETCKALAYAHRSSILHRDIKPLNIFISKYGITKIGDFGISRYADAVTREHTVWNFRSPAYSAPEQWRDENSVVQTDVYQLGCTLFHLFTRRLPFVSGSVASLIHKHLNEGPVEPKTFNARISDKLSKLILRCLSKNIGERPGIWELVDAIASDVQQTYELTINFDKNNEALVDRVAAVTDFAEESLKKDGSFSWTYADYNEALSETFELTLVDNIQLSLIVK